MASFIKKKVKSLLNSRGAKDAKKPRKDPDGGIDHDAVAPPILHTKLLTGDIESKSPEQGDAAPISTQIVSPHEPVKSKVISHTSPTFPERHLSQTANEVQLANQRPIALSTTVNQEGAFEPALTRQELLEHHENCSQNRNSNRSPSEGGGSNIDPVSISWPSNLWEEAYNRLQEEEPKILDAYEKDLLASGVQSSAKARAQDPGGGRNEPESREEQLQRLVKDKLDAVRKAQWKITVGGEDIVVRDQVSKVVRKIVTFKDAIGTAVSAEPHAALAWAGVIAILPLLTNPVTQLDDAMDGLEEISELLVRCRLIEETSLIPSSNASQRASSHQQRDLGLQLRTKTIRLYVQVLKYQIYVARQYSRAAFFRLLRDIVVVDGWRDMLGAMKKTKKSIDEDLWTFDIGVVGKIDSKILQLQGKADDIFDDIQILKQKQQVADQRLLLATLPFANYAAFNTFDKNAPRPPKCHDGTRVEILEEIQRWGEGDGDSCIFWLSGMAGTGKSTIARTVAEIFNRKNRLGASFFFSRGQGLRAEANAFFTTLAIQLSETIPEIKPYICSSIDHGHMVIGERSPSDQWDRLILQPLSALGGSILTPLVLVFVIDALDECNGAEYVPEILRLFAGASDLGVIQLRVFITSRRESYIQNSFGQIPEIQHRDLILDSGLDGRTERDISTFVRHQLTEVAKAHSIKDWPSKEDAQRLAERAGRLFIYAATACRFLQISPFPKKHLPKMLDAESTSHSSTKNLDEMYLFVLHQPIAQCEDEDDRGTLSRLFKRIVGSIIMLFEPLSSLTLEKLLSVEPGEMSTILTPLHSVLNVPDDKTLPIQMFHLSFHDFLLDGKRCTDPQLQINEGETHKILLECCLDLMSANLGKDMCSLRRPGALASEMEKGAVENHIPLEVQYACRYFVAHFQKAKTSLCDELLHAFLRKHYLHWLEALSLMRNTAEGILAMSSLESTIVAERSLDLHAFIYDAKRFMLHNRSIIENAPLQIYSSGLVFAPEKSLVRKQFEDQIPHWICILPKVPKEWGSLEQTLEGHSHGVDSVMFSPDGNRLASAAWGDSVRVWHVATGQVEQTLEGETAVFSPDGNQLASGSNDGTVQVWNLTTGQVTKTLKSRSPLIAGLAFSPDGSSLALGSEQENTVRLWNLATSQVDILSGHLGRITSVAFSPDGNRLASSSSDHTVRVWNIATGQVEVVLDYNDTPRSVAFSPDGTTIASGPKFVELRNSATGRVEGMFRGHRGDVKSVAFSPDGTRLATASGFSWDYDKTVRVWNVATRQVEQTLEGHLQKVRCVTFSPDGNRLASGSNDKSVRIWNVTKAQAKEALDSHEGAIIAMTLSPDGNKLASGSNDQTVRIWNTATGQIEQILKGHNGPTTCVAFSPNGNLLASGSNDGARVWNIATGQIMQTLNGHKFELESIAFSPDGARLASGSKDTIQVWDVATGQVEQKFEDTSFWHTCVAFSPDGNKLAAGSHSDNHLMKTGRRDGTVRVWNISTGQVEQTLNGYFDEVTSV
ncbi:WD40 repeat-like protein [Hyaloscypha hepaticicola]|uniref:WD40 repeat-like protein n=1 Tax=Hyaloscypha hepaticicola TaxID=2082293 RepID=A0A2J6PJZ3_9HELO|nr:WD40 repeat-like protein [Hyaloscypha hepaticicola]